MHKLSVPLALALSLLLATAGATLVMPPMSMAQDAAGDSCRGYLVLHARLSDARTLERFVDGFDACLATLRDSP